MMHIKEHMHFNIIIITNFFKNQNADLSWFLVQK